MPTQIEVQGLGRLSGWNRSHVSAGPALMLQRRLLRRSGTMVVPPATPGPHTFVPKIPRPARWPWLPTTCGDGTGLYPCNQGDENAAVLDGLGGFGFGASLQGLGTLGCAELDTAMARLLTTLQAAEAAGNTTSAAYTAARSFYDDESGIWTGHVVATGEVCRNLVAEANQRIASMGGIPTVPTLDPGTTSSDWLGTAKTIAIAGAIIAGVVLLAPVVGEVLAAHKFGRKAHR